MGRVIVVGGGAMGAGIAFVAAAAGFAVDLVEPDPQGQDRARQRITKDAERAQALHIVDRITYHWEIPRLTEVEVAIEAVPERFDLKRKVFYNLADRLEPTTLLATNTSSFSVTEIAADIESPDRVLGLHFFNPPAAMKLVEIVVARETSSKAIERARSFVEHLRKVPVVAADTPGFIVNRVARPYYLQAMRAYEAGSATIEDIDQLARGIGFRMGPFELMDLIGIDINLATSESVYERTGAERLQPVKLQKEMFSKNLLGRKTHAGFYTYPPETRLHDESTEDELTQTICHERIVILGTAPLARELSDVLQAECVDEVPAGVTVVVDTGDGAQDRSSVIEDLDARLPENVAIFSDAYATDLAATSKRLRFPRRLVGYGILGSFERQNIIEILNLPELSALTLERATALFGSLGRRVISVNDRPGLILGRTIASIVNEATYVVAEKVASPEDVDLAMELGTNYPVGPIAWGNSIGTARIRRILERLAEADGDDFAAHPALRGGTPSIRLAATVMLLRSTGEGFEVLMVRRNSRSSFAPDAYVFPGGTMDSQDTSLEETALRELREEAGIALGSTSELLRFSHWITPPSEPRRFDTLFFIAQTPEGQIAQADAQETHDELWIAPKDALIAERAGTLYLVYPTIKHLERLARFRTIEDVFEFTRSKPIVTISPAFSAAEGFTIPEEIEHRW